MVAGKKILIVSANQLACIGLKTILQESFSPGEIIVLADLHGSDALAEADIAFVSSDTYVRQQAKLRTSKAHIIVLTEDARDGADTPAADPDTLSMAHTEQEIADRLEALFRPKTGRSPGGLAETLTPRETDVLRCVSQGYLNKQIADMLSISQHTVISHRKNITQKLGIKTVSGLTMYALLHGLITSKEH